MVGMHMVQFLKISRLTEVLPLLRLHTYLRPLDLVFNHRYIQLLLACTDQLYIRHIGVLVPFEYRINLLKRLQFYR